MSIASEITRLSGVRNDIFTSITNKGVTVPQTATFSSCPGLIDSIVTGGGGSNNLYNTTAEGSGSCFGTVTITASQIATPLTYDTGDLTLTASAWVSTGSLGTSRFVHNGYLMPWSAISPFTATGSFSLSRSGVGTVSTATYPYFGIPATVSASGALGVVTAWWGISGGPLAAGSTGLRYAQSISDTYANQFTNSITSMAQHLKPTDIVFLGFTGAAAALTGTAANVQATVSGITSVSEWGYPYPDRDLVETATVTASAICRETLATGTTTTGMALIGRSNRGELVGELSSRTWTTTNTGYPLISVRVALTAVSGAFPGVEEYAFSTATYPRNNYTFTSSMDLVSSTINLI